MIVKRADALVFDAFVRGDRNDFTIDVGYHDSPIQRLARGVVPPSN
jgi:hypothetical protein